MFASRLLYCLKHHGADDQQTRDDEGFGDHDCAAFATRTRQSM
jgi:hypothetical protein